MSNEIKIEFLGGASAIGASSMVIETNGARLLIDCGVRFVRERPIPNLDCLTGKKLDAIILTHAHTDHSGALPLVHRAFPKVPIFMTPPTKNLITVLYNDALKIMDDGLDREGDIPLYSEQSVTSMLKIVQTVDHWETREIAGVEVTFFPASHIMGASMIYLNCKEGAVLVTGDYCVTPQRTLRPFMAPKVHVDILITESTYGNRLHSDRKLSEQKLIQEIQKSIKAGGKVLIPAFAVGRAQEVLLILKRAIKSAEMQRIPIYVDGMVRSVCEVYSGHERYLNERLVNEAREGNIFYGRGIKPVLTRMMRESIVEEEGPAIIVSSSGMLSGGASVFYAKALVGKAENAIILTGYQDEESPGRALLKALESDEPQPIFLGGEKVELKCRLTSYSLSAHADKMQMMGLLQLLRPQTVILVHGDEQAKESMAHDIDCDDVVIGQDGMIVTRTIEAKKKRRRGIASKKTLPEKVTFQTIEDLGLGEEGIDPSKVKMAKGELVLLCSNQNLGTPQLEFKKEEGLFLAKYQLTLPNEEVLESRYWGHRLKTLADQMAAFELVLLLKKKLTELLPAYKDGIVQLSESELEELKGKNHKGILFERLIKNQLAFPQFHSMPYGLSFRIYGELILADGEVKHSKVYEVSQKKSGEQAVSRELLEWIPDIEKKVPQNPVVGVVSNYIGLLNELKQKRVIQDFKILHTHTEGVEHSPVFTMKGVVIFHNGSSVEGDDEKHGSKKECKTMAAKSVLLKAKLI